MRIFPSQPPGLRLAFDLVHNFIITVMYNNLTAEIAEHAEVISVMTRPQDILLVFLAACRDVLVLSRRSLKSEVGRLKPEASLIFVFLCALRDLRGEQKKIRKTNQ